MCSSGMLGKELTFRDYTCIPGLYYTVLYIVRYAVLSYVEFFRNNL